MSEERPDPKGKISADISQDAVAEALRSVEARARGEEPEAPGVVIESDDEPDSGEGSSADPAELAALREELKLKDMLLEQSQKMGRTGMERLKEANERMLRASADLENYKKRAQKEKEELQKFGNERLLKELLPVLDNFDRALEHAQKGADLKSFTDGVGMTRKLFEDTLGKFGVKSFTAVGESFDPHRHEAIQQMASTEHPAHVVVSEIVRGYLLNDRLVRPAMVVVSTGPGPASAAEPEPASAAPEVSQGAETVRIEVPVRAAEASGEATAEASGGGAGAPEGGDPGEQRHS